MLTLGVIASHGVKSFRSLIDSAIGNVDDIIVAVDSGGHEPGIYGYKSDIVQYFFRPLAHDFSAQRNSVVERMKPGWILFLDSDENIGEWLWKNIISLTEFKSDLIMLPRSNYVEGISRDENDLLGWPDWQPKMHREHVRWQFPVHEWPVGFKKQQFLPSELKYAILHRKTAADQAKANELYARIIDKPSAD